MRLSSLLYFYRLRLRTRWVQELFALVGIAGGVALLFAAQVANTSITGSVEQLVDATIGRAELAVTARTPQGFDERLTEQVRAIPGVRVAAPLVEVRANVARGRERASVTVLGVDKSVTALGGSLLGRFRDAPVPAANVVGLPSPIAARLGLAVGQPLQIEAGGVSTSARLGASLGRGELSTLTESPIAVAPLAFAQRFGGLDGRVTRVLVKTEPGQLGAVEAEIARLAGPGLTVRPAQFDLNLMQQAAAPTSQSTGIFAGMSALVGFLFAFNAMLLTVASRRQLIVALREDGYAPAVIFRVAVFDALLLGIVASALGLVLGDALSRELFSPDPGYLSIAFAVGDQRVVEWQTVVLSGLAGITATVLAALIPLRDLLRARPAVVGPESGHLRPGGARVALVLGLVLLGVCLAVTPTEPGPALLAVGGLVAALMLCLPAALIGTLTAAQLALRSVRSAIPMISLGELRSMPTRSIAVAATGALAVFASVASQGARGDLQTGLDRSATDVIRVADVWVSARGTPNQLATDFLTDDHAATIRAVPSVERVAAYRGAFLDIGDRRTWVLAQPPGSSMPVPASQIVDGDVQQATARIRGGGWAVMSDRLAAARGLDVGDRFVLPTARPVTLRVAALSTNVGWPPGAIVIAPADFERGWATTAPTALQVSLNDGVTPAEGRLDVVRALGAEPALAIETAAARESRFRESTREALDRLSEMSVLVLVAAVLALAAATGAMVWQRRRRLAALKLDGFEDKTVWKALLLESALLLGAGCLVGALFGLAGQQILDRALATVTGFPVVHSIGLGFAFLSFALVTAVAVAVAGLPGYLAARVPPATALQD